MNPLLQAETRSWTAREFERMVELGIIGEDERVELVEGRIVQMPPIGPGHADSVMCATHALAAAFGATHYLRVQLPLKVRERSEPQPDFALIPKGARDPVQHPSTADLVIEVADTSLAYDREVKAAVYAAAGIPEYWLVNLPERCLEVRRHPGPDSASMTGHSYRSLQVHRPEESVSPLFCPRTALPVAVFFGPV
ncbi:MAG TPA: Uma2 family endonuclease [Candidatus Nitrosotenuis sp.]|nr:Uma2 family endonuclease [Candidatus Nitrosotenuis sp.]